MLIDYTSLVRTVLNEKKNIAAPNSLISTWTSWYKGKVPSFHQYYIYNGKKKVKRYKKSLQMAKQVCEDWASLLMNEKVQIVVSDKDKMENLLLDIDFWNKANKSVEYGFGLSMSALVLSVVGLKGEEDEEGNIILTDRTNAKVILDVVSARKIVPIEWENGQITECAFVYENTNDTIVQIHRLNEQKQYEVTNITINNETSDIKETSILYTMSERPWFVIIHPQLVNNLDIDSPYPISVFANAVDTLKAIDNKYDSFDVEFVQGKKRTFVSAKLNKVDEDSGEVINTFDPDDTVIYQLPESTSANGEENNLIKNVSDPLRTQEHSQAIQDELNLLSKSVGLGVDYYRFEKGRVMTATQVISEKSDTFRNLKKHEGVFEKALTTLMRSLMYICNTFTNTNFNDPEDVRIIFDDSIIEDKTTEKENDMKDVQNGIMSKVAFRMKWFGEDEETAKTELKKFLGDTDLASRIAVFGQALTQGYITYEEYVAQVYPDKNDSERALIVEQLKEQAKSTGSITAEDLGLYQPTENK